MVDYKNNKTDQTSVGEGVVRPPQSTPFRVLIYLISYMD